MLFCEDDSPQWVKTGVATVVAGAIASALGAAAGLGLAILSLI
jgi:hypothetical protein